MWSGVLLALVLDVRAEEPAPGATMSQSDGFWRTELMVPAPLAEVRAALEDPIASAKFSPDISSLTYLSRGGDCPTLRAQLSGITSFSYDYRRCVTKNGWHETLISSPGLEVYEVTWELEPAGDATRVRYAIKVDPTMPAPEFVLARQVKATMSTIVGRLYRKVTGTRASDD